MTFDEFILAVKYRPSYEFGYERYGQAFMNQLYSSNPSLYRRMLLETEFDPFYAENKFDNEVLAAYYWLRTHWND